MRRGGPQNIQFSIERVTPFVFRILLKCRFSSRWRLKVRPPFQAFLSDSRRTNASIIDRAHPGSSRGSGGACAEGGAGCLTPSALPFDIPNRCHHLSCLFRAPPYLLVVFLFHSLLPDFVAVTSR